MRRALISRFRPRPPARSAAGFTLLELLVVVVIVTVLGALMAPAWTAFMNRQRVGSARDQVMDVLKSAQSKARTSRTPQVVYFDKNPGGVPQFFVSAVDPDNIPQVPANPSWQRLGSGEIQPGNLFLETNSPNPDQGRIVFDSDGAVLESSVNGTTPFVVWLSAVDITAATDPQNRCVRVETLLGAMSAADNSGNETPCQP